MSQTNHGHIPNRGSSPHRIVTHILRLKVIRDIFQLPQAYFKGFDTHFLCFKTVRNKSQYPWIFVPVFVFFFFCFFFTMSFNLSCPYLVLSIILLYKKEAVSRMLCSLELKHAKVQLSFIRHIDCLGKFFKAVIYRCKKR